MLVTLPEEIKVSLVCLTLLYCFYCNLIEFESLFAMITKSRYAKKYNYFQRWMSALRDQMRQDPKGRVNRPSSLGESRDGGSSTQVFSLTSICTINLLYVPSGEGQTSFCKRGFTCTFVNVRERYLETGHRSVTNYCHLFSGSNVPLFTIPFFSPVTCTKKVTY